MVSGIAKQTGKLFIERIIREHLIGNKVVEEYAFLTHPLPETSLVSCEHLIEA